MNPQIWVDTHCHLDAAEFAADRQDALACARQAGVAAQLIPAVSLANCADVAALTDAAPDCLPAFGLHPVYTAHHAFEDVDALVDWFSRYPQACAVGEIGLDFFVPALDRKKQEDLFVAQLRLAQRLQLPVILHVRRAVDAILKCLRRYPVVGGIAHAFNGSRQQADVFISMGFKLGFGGAMTYARALRIRDLATHLPLSAIVLETDSPDITPEWAHGERNEPAHLPRIGSVLAELRKLSVAEVASATTQNALAVMGPRLSTVLELA